MKFDGGNWSLFDAVFQNEGRMFGWTPEEYKQQFLRRLTGKAAAQFADHIGDLAHMTWVEMYELASKWYGRSQDRSYFQHRFEEQKREKQWTYSQFATLLKSLAAKGNPGWSQEVLEAVLFDRLRRYARNEDHLIYEAVARERVTTVSDLIRVADQWMVDFPDRSPSYHLFYRQQKAPEFRRPSLNLTESVREEPGVSMGESRPRAFKTREWRRTPGNSSPVGTKPIVQPARVCWSCRQPGHMVRVCPNLTPEERNDFLTNRRKGSRFPTEKFDFRRQTGDVSLNREAPSLPKQTKRDGGD
jgi:hypothetical protein